MFPLRPSTKSFCRMRFCFALLLLLSCLNDINLCVCVCVWALLRKLFKNRLEIINDKTDLARFQVALELKRY